MTREELAIKIEDIIADDYIEGVSSIMELIDSQINSQINWDQVRIDAAIRIIPSMTSDPCSFENMAKSACMLANNLVEELKKYTHGHGTND